MTYSAELQGTTHKLAVKGMGSPVPVQIDGKTYEVDFSAVDGSLLSLLVMGRSYEADVVEEADGVLTVWVQGETYRIEYQEEGRRPRRGAGVAGHGASGRQVITAPMPGKVVAVLVSPEQEVSAGQGVIVIEAMKMENELKACRPGIIKEIKAQEGTAVSGGDVLVIIE
ncbi:Glutaconyl-CoA decarboxylase subunit gamma [Candidatus Methylomirabilis lanthanidiphila]|uniref:Glutaconyl-CoA decarboxylase subunit gamma n=1 Tax=Candidatus Methylomirabilis lanthanidiphila TaxID=2211376 RepID=A0A564ZIP8_9BACT|nr:acetyl-CoA carboxylase biotin carboxyl carrier protein subunit [Candidatus Methylomirabilis lanthanidiphila]VUZ85053.1 Glutaconyl-CoA decarboxylase subunit gamma [Candidatus Methylomirabilis lanthanidiphila]